VTTTVNGSLAQNVETKADAASLATAIENAPETDTPEEAVDSGSLKEIGLAV
jgi:hypothetical protein